MNKPGVCSPANADTGCQVCKKYLSVPNVLLMDIEHLVYKPGVCPPSSTVTGCQVCEKYMLVPSVLLADIERQVYE